MIASSGPLEAPPQTNSRIRLQNGGESFSRGHRGPCTFLGDAAGWYRGVGQTAGSTEGSQCFEHLKRTCALAVQPPMDAPWEVCAAERQYRDRQASGRARSIRQTGRLI